MHGAKDVRLHDPKRCYGLWKVRVERLKHLVMVQPISPEHQVPCRCWLPGSLGTRKGSLACFLDGCESAMGRRLLHTWLCRPLYRQGRTHAHVQNNTAAVTSTGARYLLRDSDVMLSP